jgi:tryptophan-rich sensory protein
MFDTPLSLILLFSLVCLAVNILFYWIGWYGHGKRGIYQYNKWLPPGFLIGIVWIAIFGALGYSFYLAYTGPPTLDESGNPVKWNASCIAIVVVASYCLFYPFITMVLNDRYAQLLNLIALFMAFSLGIIVIQENVAAFWYVLPLIVWTSYVNFADVMQYIEILKTKKFN